MSNDRKSKNIGIFPQSSSVYYDGFMVVFPYSCTLKRYKNVTITTYIASRFNHWPWLQYQPYLYTQLWKIQYDDSPKEATTHKLVSQSVGDCSHGRFEGQCVSWHYSARADRWHCNTNHHHDEPLQPLTQNDEYSIAPTLGHIVIDCIERSFTQIILFCYSCSVVDCHTLWWRWIYYLLMLAYTDVFCNV